ncbi:hypothetical protein FB451DRAFT_1563347 [Mycena latifolia]|nr:hypothetical protein FB451DRAFT_1563347 [Mycena latifolia]
MSFSAFSALRSPGPPITYQDLWWLSPLSFPPFPCHLDLQLLGGHLHANHIFEVLGLHDGIGKSKGLRRFAFFPDARVLDVPPITSYALTPTGKLTLELRHGSTLTDIDAVVLGTGYSALPSAPDAHPLISAPTAPPRIPAHPALCTHILYAPAPTLAFVSAIMSCTPFTLADVTSTWLALVFSGRLCIPDSLDAQLMGERACLAKVERACAEGADAQALRVAISAVAPAHAVMLPEWSDADRQRCEAMYERKWVSLMAERDAAAAAQKAVRDVSRL